jgi:predicted RND superfamily exporter protein
MLVHHLFNFFKDTLTVPKVKDLVQQPTASYKDIEEIISNKATSSPITIPILKENELDPDAMKNELKNFFKELKENKNKPEIASSNEFWPNKSAQNMYTEL